MAVVQVLFHVGGDAHLLKAHTSMGGVFYPSVFCVAGLDVFYVLHTSQNNTVKAAMME